MTVPSGHGDYQNTGIPPLPTTAAPPVPLVTSDDLAALHRELAANVPWDVSVMAGTAADRNVELRLAPPFPLKRLPGA
jgi:hypothetical protein